MVTTSPSPLEGEGWGGGYEPPSRTPAVRPAAFPPTLTLPLQGGGKT